MKFELHCAIFSFIYLHTFFWNEQSKLGILNYYNVFLSFYKKLGFLCQTSLHTLNSREFFEESRMWNDSVRCEFSPSLE